MKYIYVVLEHDGYDTLAAVAAYATFEAAHAEAARLKAAQENEFAGEQVFQYAVETVEFREQ